MDMDKPLILTPDPLSVILRDECLLRRLNLSNLFKNRFTHTSRVTVEREKNAPDTIITVIDIGQ